jgi:hypothetical protein
MPHVEDLTPSYYHQGRQALPPRQDATVHRHQLLAATVAPANYAFDNSHTSTTSGSNDRMTRWPALLDAYCITRPSVFDAAVVIAPDTVILRCSSERLMLLRCPPAQFQVGCSAGPPLANY